MPLGEAPKTPANHWLELLRRKSLFFAIPHKSIKWGHWTEIRSTLGPRFPDETPKVWKIRFRGKPFGGVVTVRPRFADHLKRESLTSPARKLKTEHDILSDEAKWKDCHQGRNGIGTTGGLILAAGMSCMSWRVGTRIRLFCARVEQNLVAGREKGREDTCILISGRMSLIDSRAARSHLLVCYRRPTAVKEALNVLSWSTMTTNWLHILSTIPVAAFSLYFI